MAKLKKVVNLMSVQVIISQYNTYNLHPWIEILEPETRSSVSRSQIEVSKYQVE